MDAAKVTLLPHQPDQAINLLKFSDGREVVCSHDGAPCPGCQTPREQWPKCWEPGSLRLVSGAEVEDEGIEDVPTGDYL